VAPLPKTPERGRVWLLEDSPLEAEMARRALAPAHDVELFRDGAALLERLATSALPDVVVVDWQLPGITGIEACRVLRASHDAMNLPVLLLTVQGRKEDVVEGLAAGANDYVTKPYDIAELVARVGTLVRQSRLQRVQARRAKQLALAADVGAALTRAKSLADVSAHAARAIASHLDALFAEVWVASSGGKVALAARSGPAADGAFREDVVRDAAATQEPRVTDERSGDGAVTPCPPAFASAVLPLVVRDETVGVVAVCTRDNLDDALTALTTLADLLALGIARVRFDEERALLLERERNIRAEAEAANRSKDEFLAMVSHELRTPLNAITGWTTMLMSGALDPERVKRALQTIDRNARSQAQLIDDLLDISRIISGKLRLSVGSVDVPSIAEMALESVRLAGDAKGVVLEAQIDTEAGHVAGDADRVQQIIWNLLTNAIKFTPKGGKVTLSVAREERGITISVADTGQGIAPEFLPQVFERFKQADGSLTRSKGGLGLGLAIVKHLIEVHGGTIEARSEGLGKGATFLVVLPVNASAKDIVARSNPLAARPSIEAPRDVEGLRVLVLDDEPDAREFLKELLESCGLVVTTAADAASAFDVIRGGAIDILLSDIAMPEEDGLSFIKRVRALPREEGGRTPAVALTAYARLEDRTRALRAGFNTHVAKPVDPTELLAVVSSLAAR